MTLKRIRLELARDHDFPNGSRAHGYEFAAPLDEAGHLVAAEWREARDAQTGNFCHGDRPTLADVCLVSQVVGFSYFGGTTDAFPVVQRINAACMHIDAFQRAHPLAQSDAPKA